MSKNHSKGFQPLGRKQLRQSLLKRIKREHGGLKLNELPSDIRKQVGYYRKRFYMLQSILVVGRQTYENFEQVFEELIVPESKSAITDAVLVAWLTNSEQRFSDRDFLSTVSIPTLSYGLCQQFPLAILAGTSAVCNDFFTPPPGLNEDRFDLEAWESAFNFIAEDQGTSVEEVRRRFLNGM